MKKIIVLALILSLQVNAVAAEKKVIYDFEGVKSAAEWSVSKEGKLELSTENATSGKKSLKVTLPVAEYPGFSLNIPKGKTIDWSKFDYLKMDIYTASEEGFTFEIRIDDDQSKSEEPDDVFGTWSSTSKTAQQGKQTIDVDLTLLNTNDKTRQVNLNKITKFTVFMLGNSAKTPQILFIDNIRLEKD
ncbi:MAG: hypothetical protein A2231_05180 [Candidatus Firestonebacteria bacterium RIFOXYA2_FULL_40_8]|nr:MAG: hypothetical protein A2231_05180 [Candidatus Firestonebacteria bacterium RIFOXYA2_FULL_40_8]